MSGVASSGGTPDDYTRDGGTGVLPGLSAKGATSRQSGNYGRLAR